MIFNVTRRRQRGVPLTPEQLRKTQAVRGDISINHESNILGRSSVVARMSGDEPLAPSPLPELLDCQLHSMAPNGMALTGVEEIDGVMYAQTWICRPA